MHDSPLDASGMSGGIPGKLVEELDLGLYDDEHPDEEMDRINEKLDRLQKEEEKLKKRTEIQSMRKKLREQGEKVRICEVRLLLTCQCITEMSPYS